MADKDKLASVENVLVQRYNERGYILEDEVIDCCVDNDLDLAAIDAVCDRLLKRNIIFRDSVTDNVIKSDDNEEDVYDRSQLDYGEIFKYIQKEYPSCKYLIEQIRGILPPQHKEWRTLIGEAKNGNAYARDRLILMYLRTMLKRAYDFSKAYYCDFEEAFQNAVIGFLKAIDKYDITSRDSFVSYFQLWLVQNMSRECSIKGTVMRYPVHYKGQILPVLGKVSDSYFSQDELTKAEQKIIDIHENNGDYVGIYNELETLFEEDFLDEYFEVAAGQFDYNHMIPYLPIYDDLSNDDNIEDEIIIEERNSELREMVKSCLSDREREVIVRRYGLDDGIYKTLEEVGNTLGITRERVRQIESKALGKLRLQYKMLL